MRHAQLIAITGLAALLVVQPAAGHGRGHGGLSIGLNFGSPGCYHRPWCGVPHWHYYRPAPIVYYAPPPRVIVQPAPVVVQPEPIVIQSQHSRPASNVTVQPVQPAVALREPTSMELDGAVSRNLELLKNPDANIRRDAVMELGRTRADRAVAPLTATLAGDGSPEVRDAAARALGLISAPSALPALRYAAQADSDRDVRHSCQFAVEIIQTSGRR